MTTDFPDSVSSVYVWLLLQQTWSTLCLHLMKLGDLDHITVSAVLPTTDNLCTKYEPPVSSCSQIISNKFEHATLNWDLKMHNHLLITQDTFPSTHCFPDFLTGPLSLCVDSFVFMYFFALSCLTAYVLYYCNTVGWTWWDWSPILEHLPSVLWHCWLGHLIHKNPSPIWPRMCLVGR